MARKTTEQIDPAAPAQPSSAAETLDTAAAIELNRSIAQANNSAANLLQMQLQAKLAETPEGLAATLKAQSLRQKIENSQLELQANSFRLIADFQKEQMDNLKTTLDILFRQTKGAAWMFYISYALGFLLILISVGSYLFLQNPNNVLTLAFFGAGALTLLTFFLRDPAEKVQQTAGKLVQIQFAMKCHQTEFGFWEIYVAQRQQMGQLIDIAEFEKASKSIHLSTKNIMRQIDESLEDNNGDDK